jgi:hypothetical protein
MPRASGQTEARLSFGGFDFFVGVGSCVILFRRNRAHNGRIAEMLESQTVNGTRPEPLSAKTR